MQTSIVPVAVYPSTANTLMVRSITLGPPPNYYYELQNVDAEGVVIVLKSGNISMTDAQWNAWPANADDDNVQLDAISENLGITRA
jgi:hypothetical protein